MRVVFLDFDGVLNSQPFLVTESVKGYETIGEASSLDPANVEHLNTIVRETGAVVVISSSWRHGRKLSDLRTMLESRGFVGQVLGRTPDFVPSKKPGDWRTCGERGDEIQEWLDGASLYGIEVESFVILDDNTDMAHLKDRLVQTYMDCGLTDFYAQKAIKMLQEAPSLLILPSSETVARFVP